MEGWGNCDLVGKILINKNKFKKIKEEARSVNGWKLEESELLLYEKKLVGPQSINPLEKIIKTHN